MDIPNITLGERIGGGAFGDVYRAHHRTFDVPVAVKLMRPSAVASTIPEALREARLMARLNHPNLLRVFDAGQTPEGALYLVLELMDGHCGHLRLLPAHRALDVTLQLLSGLQALHEARVLHRDIKPPNCLVRARDNRVKLADLGIAIEQATRSDEVVSVAGTLPFMAPELFENPPRFSPSSDLYTLGVTLQCLLLEGDPFPRASTAQTLAWIFRGTPVSVAEQRPDLPKELTRLVDRMSARAVAERPVSAAAALASLAAPAGQPVVGAAPAASTVRLAGAWVLGQEIPSDGNFRRYAVTHVRTGAPGRLHALRSGRPLSGQSALILASAERTSRIDHAGFIGVLDWGMFEGRAYVVLQPQGQSLEALIQSSGPFGEAEAVAAARALADALVHLHGQGLVYQTMTPGAAVLAGDGRSAQLAWPLFCVPVGTTADTSMVISVPRFSAPESLVTSDGSAASVPFPGAAEPLPGIQPTVDLYGLGETLYFLLVGRPAFSDASNLMKVLFEKMRGPFDVRAAAPATSAPTAHLVADLLAPYVQQRPASAVAVRDELDRIAEGLRARTARQPIAEGPRPMR